MSVQDSHAASAPHAIRWVRVVIAGFLAEVALVIVAIPLFLLPNGQALLNLVIPPASFVAFVAFGYWAARGAARSQVLNGFLTGVAAVVLYFCLGLVAWAVAHRDPTASMTPAYLLAHALKMAGGAAGGWLAARK